MVDENGSHGTADADTLLDTFPVPDRETKKTCAMSESDDLGGPESVAFDNVLKAIGQSTVYNVVTSVALMTFMGPYAMAILNFVFIGYEPPHVCTRTDETNLLSKYSLSNDSTAQVIYETCRIRVTSNMTGIPEDVALTSCIEGHDFVGGKHVSLKTEWGLVCEKRGMAELVLTMMNLGMAVGSLVVNPMADRFGRKKIVFLSSVCSIVLELLVAFSPTISMVIVLKTISGIFIQNLSPLSNTFGQERLRTKYRHFYGIGDVLVWTVSLIFFGGFAYALRDYSWRSLQLFTSLSGIPPLLSLFFIHESLSWLMAQGKHTVALGIIEDKCRKTGADFNVVRHAYSECVLRAKKSKENKGENAVAKYSFTKILFNRKLFVTNLILVLAYFTHNLTFTGLFLTGATFNLNRYYMFLILSAAELPSSSLCLVLIQRVGRRTIVITFLSLTSICLFISTLLVGLGSQSSQHVSNASTAFFIMGKFCINLSFACLFVSTPEFYPTTLRSIGFGMCFFTARVGGMISPFLFPLFQIANWAPGTLLTVLCMLTVGVYTLLPETKGKELPTTIEAFDALFTKQEENNEMNNPANKLKVEPDCYDNLKMDEWNSTSKSTLQL